MPRGQGKHLQDVESEMPIEIALPINSDADILTARQMTRNFAKLAGFHAGDAALISTEISSLARVVVRLTPSGEIVLKRARSADGRPSLAVVAREVNHNSGTAASKNGSFAARSREPFSRLMRRVEGVLECKVEIEQSPTVTFRKREV